MLHVFSATWMRVPKKCKRSFFEMLPSATAAVVVMTVVVVDTSVVAAGVVDWTVVVSTVLVVDPRVVTAVVSTLVVAGK